MNKYTIEDLTYKGLNIDGYEIWNMVTYTSSNNNVKSQDTAFYKGGTWYQYIHRPDVKEYRELRHIFFNEVKILRKVILRDLKMKTIRK